MNASDVPVRERGTRARSGNAMERTRAALLAATGECLARYGIRKTTMVDVAARSRVAKATLYNHFRTKDDLLAAYVDDRVSALVAAALSAGSLADSLGVIAVTLADDPALRRAANEEPALLLPLTRPSEARGWRLAREGAAAVLAAGGVAADEAQVELLLRWCVSQLAWPASSAQSLVAALSASPVDVVRPAAAETRPAPVVGWPG